jgi:RNase P protein component
MKNRDDFRRVFTHGFQPKKEQFRMILFSKTALRAFKRGLTYFHFHTLSIKYLLSIH